MVLNITLLSSQFQLLSFKFLDIINDPSIPNFLALLYKFNVPRNVTLSEAPSHGLPAIIYDLKCAGSQAYIALAKEFLERSNIDGNK